MPGYRLLNRDGSFNIIRQGMKFRPASDLYHRLLSMKWTPFILLGFAAYVVANFIFGSLFYFFCQLDLSGVTGLGKFWDCYFFSIQTLTTIGYGRIVPIGPAANVLVAVEALSGLMSLAVMTGLVFARFSRPTSRVMFSNRALISLHDGVPSLFFRIVNARPNQIVEAQVRVVLVINETTREGEEYRTIHDLELERDRSAIFAASWTVVHPITGESPLHGQSKESLEASEAEILVSLTGIDETFAQTIHSRYSYVPSEIVWNKYFEDILERSDGKLRIDIAKVNQLKGERAQP